MLQVEVDFNDALKCPKALFIGYVHRHSLWRHKKNAGSNFQLGISNMSTFLGHHIYPSWIVQEDIV